MTVGLASSHLTNDPTLILAFCGGMTSFSAAIAAPAHAWRDGSRRSAMVVLITTPLLCISAYALGATL
jgi:fluoride ion exporter CrcB/FEX